MPTTKSIHINGGCQLGKNNKQQLAFRIQLAASCACFWQTASQMALQKLTIPSANGSGIGFCFWQSPSVCVIFPQQGGRLQVISWFINAITRSSSMFFYHHKPTQNLVLGDILSNCSLSFGGPAAPPFVDSKKTVGRRTGWLNAIIFSSSWWMA